MVKVGKLKPTASPAPVTAKKPKAVYKKSDDDDDDDDDKVASDAGSDSDFDIKKTKKGVKSNTAKRVSKTPSRKAKSKQSYAEKEEIDDESGSDYEPNKKKKPAGKSASASGRTPRRASAAVKSFKESSGESSSDSDD